MLRFAGDSLEPQEISDALGVAPTRAYRFWHGRVGARTPSIRAPVIEAFAALPAEIETDFHTD